MALQSDNRVTVPTLVIGVGGAGCRMANAVHEQFEHATSDGTSSGTEALRVIGIDTNALDLKRNTPLTATTISLGTTQAEFSAGKDDCSYLDEATTLSMQGTARQRELGRYLISIPESVSDVEAAIKRALNSFGEQARTEGTPGPDIWILTGLGGGTGSGAFPLLAALADHCLREQYPSGRLFGVGALPQFPVYSLPVSDPSLYLNAYTALRELLTLTGYETVDGPDPTDQFPLDISLPQSSPSLLKLQNPPFDLFGLISINEEETSDREHLDDRNQMVADAVRTVTETPQFDSVRFRGSGSGKHPRIVGIQGNGLHLPVDHLRQYVQQSATDREDAATDETSLGAQLKRPETGPYAAIELEALPSDDATRETVPTTLAQVLEAEMLSESTLQEAVDGELHSPVNIMDLPTWNVESHPTSHIGVICSKALWDRLPTNGRSPHRSTPLGWTQSPQVIHMPGADDRLRYAGLRAGIRIENNALYSQLDEARKDSDAALAALFDVPRERVQDCVRPVYPELIPAP